MSEANKTRLQRIARTKRVRAKLVVTEDRPKLLVDRSHKSIYAQVIDHRGGVLAASNSLKSQTKNLTEAAKLVGADIAEKALAKGVKNVVFDRKHYRYHGRVKALAEAAREKGLNF